MSDLKARDGKHLWHPYTRHAVDHDPLLVARADGALLHLEDGRTLIDGISSWWTCLHGHGHPRLIEAMERQARTLDHVLFAGATHEPAVALAEELIAVAPPDLARVFYSDDGSTAVEVALKIAYLAHLHAGETQRTIFVALEESYHGDTFGAMSIGERAPFFEAFGPLLFEVRRVAPDAGALETCLAELEGRVAAVILEPLVQGAAGMRMHAPDFLRAARTACDGHGLPLIIDEVMTGFGRTGTLFACEQAGISPDLLCIAKGLTSGMLPLAATLATERLFESFLHSDAKGFFPHGHSMTANPIGCAVARASLALCRENDTPARLDAIGRRIETAIEDLRDQESVADLRRTGGIVALDLRPKDQDGAGYFAAMSPRIRAAAIDRGVLLRPLGNVLYALPPACTTDEQCDAIAACIRDLVAET